MNLTETMQNNFNYYISQVHTCTPAKIVSYDYETKKASVQPLIKKVLKDDDGVVSDVVTMPIVTGVPVMFPCTVSSSITFPINKDDPVLLLIAERSLDAWLSTGKESEPTDNRKFDLTDGIAIPGLFSFADTSQADNNTDLLIKHNDGKIRIDASGNILANDGTDYAVAYEDLKTVVEELQNDLTTLKAAMGAGWVVSPTDGGAALKAAIATWFATPITGNMATTKVEDVRLP